MASIKQNDVQITNNSINPDILKGQPLNLNQTRTDSANITNENDRNSNLSPSKSADPARKKTFKIISVKKGGSGSGDLPGDNDGDSIDGLDESQTEDLSSEFYDSSKATDLDMDLPDSMMPLTPDEVTSTTTIVVKQKPDRDSQSRFKVVKIETKEPFRRGKWVCYDYFDTTPASVVTLEKNGSKMTEDSILHSALSGNLSSSSSVHYVQDVNDSSSNIYVTPFAPISPIGADGQHLFSDVFVPIPLAPPASQVLNPGLSSADATPFIAQQVFLSMAGVPSSNTSFYSVAQPGQTTIIQSLPPTNVFPYAQNGPSASLFQNGVAGQSNVLVNLPPDPIIATASVIPAVIPPMQPISVADVTAVNQDHGPGYVIVGGIPVPRSQSQTQISGVPVLSQVLQPVIENGQSLPAVGISNATNVTYSSAESASAFSGLEVDQMGPGMDESTGSIKTLQGDPEGYPPQGLEEAVEAIHTGLEGNDEDADESGGSTVAIDNKIEQAMDLVKRHLMYAVREEVEILKQQIGEMMERIGQLEYENTVLRAEAKPETLNKLLLPRVTQAQPTSALPAPTSAAPAPQQGQPSTSAQALANHNTQNVTPQSQTQIHVQPPAQPVPQQQVQPTPGQQGTHAPSQAGHPPST